MVKKPSVVDQIVENLRDFLKSDVLTIGQKLPSETELAHRYGVGRSTIREALRLLQAQGFVELRPNAGAFLSSKEPDSTKAIHWIAEHGCRTRKGRGYLLPFWHSDTDGASLCRGRFHEPRSI